MAVVSSGYEIGDPAAFAKRITALMAGGEDALGALTEEAPAEAAAPEAAVPTAADVALDEVLDEAAKEAAKEEAAEAAAAAMEKKLEVEVAPKEELEEIITPDDDEDTPIMPEVM